MYEPLSMEIDLGLVAFYLFIQGHESLAFLELFRAPCALFVRRLAGDDLLVLGRGALLRRRRHLLHRVRRVVARRRDGG